MGIPLHSRSQGQAPRWCARFVGLPYERGARGPGLWDCWGLLMLVLKQQFGHDIPAYEGIVWHSRHDPDGRKATAAVMESETARLWRPVEDLCEQAGDAIVLRILGAPLHVGVVAAPGWMLHASEDADSALERYDGIYWHNRVTGFYRFGRDG